ncbi:MAG: hypothetical protein ACOC35_02825 [Promethearchaeia archaeon]
MDKETSKKDLEEQKSSKEKNSSNQDSEIGSELSELETMVKGALTELTDLESNLIDVISPSPDAPGKKESNYLMAVRRFQNAMKAALMDGSQKRNFETFEEGFSFYENALEILQSTGNKAELDQLKSEFSKLLMDIISADKNKRDPKFIPFIQKSCIKLAEIYESFGQYNSAIKFHNKNIELFKNNPLQADLERFQIYINYFLLKKTSTAQNYTNCRASTKFHQFQGFFEIRKGENETGSFRCSKGFKNPKYFRTY